MKNHLNQAIPQAVRIPQVIQETSADVKLHSFSDHADGREVFFDLKVFVKTWLSSRNHPIFCIKKLGHSPDWCLKIYIPILNGHHMEPHSTEEYGLPGLSPRVNSQVPC